MCLAVPARVVESDGKEAIADLHGNRVRVSTLLIPDIQDGDWILMHAGFAIQRIDAEEAKRTWDVLQDLDRVSQGEAPLGGYVKDLDEEPKGGDEKA